MDVIHFLNVLEGDCNIIQHSGGNTTVIDVSNAKDKNFSINEWYVQQSDARKAMYGPMRMPTGKIDYGQKGKPDNPITYLQRISKDENVHRFVITHPDMDHLDGIRDFFSTFRVTNVWDTENNKEMVDFKGLKYNKEDWEFYKGIRDKGNHGKRLCLHAKDSRNFWNGDNLHILAPTPELVKDACECGKFNDSSYVLLFTPPKRGGDHWKILFAGDSEDKTWNHILGDPVLKSWVKDVDVLFAPHHGRDSSRSYEFLETVKPKVTLFGNANSEYLAYDRYPETRITNNQAGYVILEAGEDALKIFVKNEEFAVNFRNKRGWNKPWYNASYQAYGIGQINAV